MLSGFQFEGPFNDRYIKCNIYFYSFKISEQKLRQTNIASGAAWLVKLHAKAIAKSAFIRFDVDFRGVDGLVKNLLTFLFLHQLLFKKKTDGCSHCSCYLNVIILYFKTVLVAVLVLLFVSNK